MEKKEPIYAQYMPGLHTAREFGGKSTVAPSWLTFVLVCPNTHPHTGQHWPILVNSGQYWPQWAGPLQCPTICHDVPTHRPSLVNTVPPTHTQMVSTLHSHCYFEVNKTFVIRHC